MRDHQAVEMGGCTVPRDHDVRPRYDGEAALWPPAAMDMDRARMEADGWGPCEGLAMPQVHDAGGWGRNRFWARCPRFSCGRLFEGRSEASVERKMREHLGTLR